MIILERFCDHKTLGCFGELYINGEFSSFTVEQPWNNNLPFKSCVPVGEYALEPFESMKYGSVVVLVNQELGVYASPEDAAEGDRYACLFHSANWAHQLQGCIAPGKALAWGRDNRNGGQDNMMVTSSGTTLKMLLPKLLNQRLLIRWKHSR